MKYFEKRKLKKYLHHLETGNFPDGYIEFHKHKIDCLKWIIGYYENRAGNPKQLLEAMLSPYNPPPSQSNIEWIKFLYYWVYYKQITGF